MTCVAPVPSRAPRRAVRAGTPVTPAPTDTRCVWDPLEYWLARETLTPRQPWSNFCSDLDNFGKGTTPPPQGRVHSPIRWSWFAHINLRVGYGVPGFT